MSLSEKVIGSNLCWVLNFDIFVAMTQNAPIESIMKKKASFSAKFLYQKE